MADVPPNISGPAAGIVQRAKDILLKPKETWPVIAAEPATTQSIYVPYVVVLAAIGPIAQFVGGQVFGFTAFGVTYHPPIDRKSVVSGKSVSVRVDLGGRRIIKKKKEQKNTNTP